MTDVDLRGFRIALVADELINGGPDLLAAFERLGWGVIVLPASWYPEDVAGPLLAAVADQVHEFSRHGYALALVGERSGLEPALAAVGLELPPRVAATSAAALEAGLAEVAKTLTPTGAAAAQRTR